MDIVMAQMAMVQIAMAMMVVMVMRMEMVMAVVVMGMGMRAGMAIACSRRSVSGEQRKNRRAKNEGRGVERKRSPEFRAAPH